VTPETGKFTGRTPYESAKEPVIQAYHAFLFEQIAMGKTGTIVQLLRGGISPNLTDGAAINDSLLHWACSFGNTETARVLLIGGSKVNSKNAIGQTPLHLACSGMNDSLISILLSYGADPTIQDDNGKDCLERCPLTEDEIKTLHQRIQEKGEYANAPKPSDETASLDGADDGDDGDDIYPDEMREDIPQPLLVFWPPAKHQYRNGAENLLLSSSEIIYLHIASEDIDVYPVLSWSGLMETIDSHGFTLQVKRSYAGSRLRMCVDAQACPGRHRYDLRVSSDVGICIVASDTTGLLYSAYALVQLLTLHSDITQSSGVTTLSVPAVHIIDYPDTMNRGVLWSYRKDVRSSSSNMRQCIEVFSKLRLNQLYLVVDVDENEEDGGQNMAIAAKMFALDEVCRRHYVDLIPTVIILTATQRVSLDLLRNFSSKTVALFLHLDQSQCSESACIEVCQEALSTIAMAGFCSVVLSCSLFVSKVVNPHLRALHVDLTVLLFNVDDLLNPSLFAKPILCTQTIHGLLSRASALVVERGQSVNILPAMLDSDFMYPLLHTKFICYLHGGYAWNRSGVCDMLGTFEESRILRETMSQILFNQASEDLPDLLTSALDLLTTQRYSGTCADSDEISAVRNTQGYFNTHTKRYLLSIFLFLKLYITAEMFLTEKILWNLIKSNYDGINICPMPSKESFTEYLKIIRKAQAYFKVKVNDITKFLHSDQDGSDKIHEKTLSRESRQAIEVFELLSTLHLMSAVCRSIALAYNAEEKVRTSGGNEAISFVSLMKHLQPGTKSDTVNTLLEATDYCANIWRFRYDILYFRMEVEKDASAGRNDRGVLALVIPSTVNYSLRTYQKTLARKYLLTKGPELPVLAVMHVVGEKLPVSINTIMAKFFVDNK
jgi:hypothetical protein